MSPARSLVKAGLVRIEAIALPDDPLNAPAPVSPFDLVLTGEQEGAVREVVAAVAAESFAVFLLFGVTGSGKTEVYLRAIGDCVARGKQAIVLVPEIALTPQTARRFRERFARVAVLHSAQTEAERSRHWRAVRSGEVDVVVGPRSAVFAPLPRLGLVVVDEEHDTSFKQANAPRYNGRDVAVVRARNAGAVAILGSATPSLESYYNARAGKYRLLALTARVGGGELPPVELVDMARETQELKHVPWLSRRLKRVLTDALARGEQAMLFLNRRGYTRAVFCRTCGTALQCRSCSLALTWHQGRGRAVCHLCGFERRVPELCPACQNPSLNHRGFGTERIEEAVREVFPTAKVARMDSDTMTTRDSHERLLDRVARHEVDVLVGTQMIAKGLHFPDITVVGVLDADTSLALPDFRASERTFQLVAQVAGRAGRSEKGGRVIVQTFRPAQPALTAAAAHDYTRFAAEELREREPLRYPPFGRLLLVVLAARNAEVLEQRAGALKDELTALYRPGEALVLGPAMPPVERVKGKYRRQIVVKAKGTAEIARAVARLRGAGRRIGVDVAIDVDPVGLA
jgi:primosomal protein N' (replication factor Y)